jgi:glycosyltransferase involved in cell wall biosynthesis
MLHASGVLVHYLIVGGIHPIEPEYQDELKHQVRQSPLEPFVHFVGAQQDVPLWMQAMDIFTLPSVGREGFGMALIEAMALGKRVVATQTGGPEEIITQGSDGCLAPPGDPQALAEAIEQSLGNAPTHRAICSAARKRAAEFGVRRFAETVARELETLQYADAEGKRR